MNHLPPRPDPNEYDELVIPPQEDPYEGMGAVVWVLFFMGFLTAAGFIWAFLKVAW